MNILQNRIRVRKESLAHSVLLDLRKTILVASQFFAFSHSLGHVWTAPAVQGESDYQRSARVQSCIRPLNAAF
jgi:hypothetical protein